MAPSRDEQELGAGVVALLLVNACGHAVDEVVGFSFVAAPVATVSAGIASGLDPVLTIAQSTAFARAQNRSVAAGARNDTWHLDAVVDAIGTHMQDRTHGASLR